VFIAALYDRLDAGRVLAPSLYARREIAAIPIVGRLLK